MQQAGTIATVHNRLTIEVELYEDEGLLVMECEKGNRTAKKVLYEKYHSVLLGVGMRYIGNQSDAEDVLHEAFIKIFNSLGQFKSKSRLGTWLTRILINECLQYLKKRNKSRMHFVDEVPEVVTVDDDAEIEASLLDEFTCEELVNQMNELPDGYRTVLCLYSIDGWSHKEIGQKLGIGESTSRSQLTKARKMFAEILKRRKP